MKFVELYRLPNFISLVFVAWLPSLAFAQVAFRPNVLIIMADDLGYSDLSCYGGEMSTPAIDRLASKGLRYSAFYTSARCSPSRASLLTGLYPHQTGIGSFVSLAPDPHRGPGHFGRLNDNCATLAQLLGDQGYSTWMVGKWHLGGKGPIVRGFQNYYGFKNFQSYGEDQWAIPQYERLPPASRPELNYEGASFYATDAFTDYALEFLRQARSDRYRPWFLFVSHSSPHVPLQAPKPDIDRYMSTYRKGWDVLRVARLERMKKLGLVAVDAPLPPREIVPVDANYIANGFSGEPNPGWDSLDEDRREDLARRMATYAAMVKHIDTGIDRIVNSLEKNFELEKTIILFMSDNGACYEWGPFGFDGESRGGRNTLHTDSKLDQFGQAGSNSSYGSAWANLCNTPLKMYEHFCHEGGLRSPLVVHWPKGITKPGRIVRDPVHLMDIVPTILEISDSKYPSEFKGQPLTPLTGMSMVPTFRGEQSADRMLAFEHQSARGLRRGDWKLVWGKRMNTDPRWELYDLSTDPSELNDQAASKPELVAELSAAWLKWAKEVGVDPFWDEK
jgi:arylsulfatase